MKAVTPRKVEMHKIAIRVLIPGTAFLSSTNMPNVPKNTYNGPIISGKKF